MESSIKIDFVDNGLGKGLEPVIKVKIIHTEDPRDKLLSTFFQVLGGESNWLSVRFDGYTGGGEGSIKDSYISIFPISSNELKETINLITSRIDERDRNSYHQNETTVLEPKAQTAG